MKLKYLCSILFVALPCLGHPRHHAAALLDERQAVEQGAARIIHTIRGAEQALAKDLRGNPRLLLSEERLLHKASQLALKAGQMKARHMHSAQKLHNIEASLIEHVDSSSGAHLGSLARKEAKLLRGGRGILQEVKALKGHFKEALGKSNPEVAAKLMKLMSRVDGAQRDILSSEAEATVHAAQLTAAIRKEKGSAAAVGAFAQQSTRESTGTKDPVRRMKLAQEALGQLKAAKSEVTEAYGSDDGTAQKVEAMMDQLQGHLQGLEESSEEDSKVNVKAEEADMFANIEKEIQAKRAKKSRKGSRTVSKPSSHSEAFPQVQHGMYDVVDMLVH